MSEERQGTVWDQRFDREDYVYGRQANDFLREAAAALPEAPAHILSLAEGEGRNAVYLAKLGHRITAVDSSSVGLEKARKLAAAEGVDFETVLADLADYEMETGAWDAVVSIFCHLPPALRSEVHAAAARALRPGGVVILEGYTPKQLDYRTGGPPVPELLYTAEMLREDFAGLDFEILREVERDIQEGVLHQGRSAVVQLLARKPS